MRLTPYRVDDRLLLDGHQVIPLQEAQELMVRFRERETAAQVASSRSDGAERAQYIVTTPVFIVAKAVAVQVRRPDLVPRGRAHPWAPVPTPPVSRLADACRRAGVSVPTPRVRPTVRRRTGGEEGSVQAADEKLGDVFNTKVR